VPRLFGLIPAAGKSRRMGRSKLALPFGTATVLEHVCRAVLAGGAERVLVVAGPHGGELVPLAKAAGADVLLLDRETAEMRHTVEHGLAWLERHCQPTSDDAWLLLPADHPCLEPDVIAALAAARKHTHEATIFVPTFAGQRGHPVLLAWTHVPGIRALPDGTGLNVYLRCHGSERREVPVATDAVLRDLDTPEDYRRLLGRGGGGVPGEVT
jgi:CTP:molybdopterin cytidylyltransferase MocA